MKRWSEVLKKENLVILLLAGILLLIIAMPVKEKEGEETETQNEKKESTVGSMPFFWDRNGPCRPASVPKGTNKSNFPSF